jgi:hypothetical protein
MYNGDSTYSYLVSHGSKYNNYKMSSSGSISKQSSPHMLAHLNVFFSDQCDGVTGIQNDQSNGSQV